MKNNYIVRGMKYLKNHDISSLFLKMSERLYRDYLERDYDKLAKENMVSAQELKRQSEYQFSEPKKFSIIVPLYNTPEKYLREMIESVLEQSYGNLELCLADGSTKDEVEWVVEEYREKDPRIRYKKLEENKGISENTNEALNLATGDFVGLFDHDDLLEKNALYEIMKVLEMYPKTDIVYTDEDKLDGESNTFFGPNFKPDFDLELLRTNNYICHFFVVRRQIIQRVGGFCSEFDGAQDYDFIFRCTEATMEIRHIPKVLYHWRTHSNSTSASPESKMYAYESAKRAIEAHFQRVGVKGSVETTANYGFFNYTVPEMPRENVKIIRYDEKDTGDSLNKLAEKTKAQVLIFMPKQVEFSKERFDQVLAGKCMLHGIGAVSCMQVKGRKVKEAGLVLDRERMVSSYFENYNKKRTGYFHRLSLSRSVSAVSTVFAIRKDILKQMEGFASMLSPGAAQIDLCVRLKEMGYRNIYTPLAVAKWKVKYPAGKLTEEDVKYLQQNYEALWKQGDSYYNPCCESVRYEYGLRRNR